MIYWKVIPKSHFDFDNDNDIVDYSNCFITDLLTDYYLSEQQCSEII